MSYPTSTGSPANGTAPRHSLPARPPPSASLPAHLPLKSSGGGNSYGHANPAYGAAANSSHYMSGAPGAGPAITPGFSSQHSQHSYYPSNTEASYGAPQIVNPFPLPGQAPSGRSGYDPELEAQIAQWQSAYAPKEDAVSRGGTGSTGSGAAAGKLKDNNFNGRTGHSTPAITPDNNAYPYPEATTASNEKPKTVVRSGGGKQWEDSTLLEWDPSHFRIFVGNLAGEVTDDSLLKAFSKYPSVQKARVVRDKRTTKSKGFGFVSFSNGDDYFKAAKEMQNKYIGSHPVKISRADSEVRPVVAKDHDKKKNGKNKKYNGNNHKSLHANTGAGVHKNTKDKSGLKLLG